MTSAQVCILISIAVYLIAMLAIGIVCSKRNNTVDDFYLGGRRLGPVVTAMSAEASDMSSWLLMGLPGVAYLTGVADPGGQPLALVWALTSTGWWWHAVCAGIPPALAPLPCRTFSLADLERKNIFLPPWQPF